MYIYVAQFKYGNATLMKAQMVKETPKTYMISSSEKILGSMWIGKRLLKSQKGIFHSQEEATSYLIECAKNHIIRCADNLEKARAELHSLLAFVNEKPSL